MKNLVLVLSLVTATLATAPPSASAKSGYAPFGEPPRSKNGAGVRMEMVRWYFYIDNGHCAFKDKATIKRKLADIDRMILALPADEQQIHIDYRNQLSRFFGAQMTGVPGVGTWKELDAKRIEALAWYEANTPPREPASKSPEDVAAFGAKLKAFRERAEADRAFIAKLEASACVREGVFPISKWKYIVSQRQVDDRMTRAYREHAQTLNNLTTARDFLKQYTGASYKYEHELGRMLHDAVSLYTNMQEELTKEQVIFTWAETFGADALAEARAQSAEYRELMPKIAALYADGMRKVKLPARSKSSKAQSIARKLVGKQVAVHATSGVNRVSNPQSDIITKNGKQYERSWTEVLEEVEIWYVSREKPKQWFVDMPGVPLSNVCSLKVAAAHKYIKGVGVKLGKWMLEEDEIISPIPCK